MHLEDSIASLFLNILIVIKIGIFYALLWKERQTHAHCLTETLGNDAGSSETYILFLIFSLLLVSA